MRSHLFALAVLTTAFATPVRSQSIAGAQVGLTASTQAQSPALHDVATSRHGTSSLVSRSDESGDKWAKGMMAGALVGLVVGLLINVNQLQEGGTHGSAILPAVGVGALLGLMIGTG